MGGERMVNRHCGARFPSPCFHGRCSSGSSEAFLLYECCQIQRKHWIWTICRGPTQCNPIHSSINFSFCYFMLYHFNVSRQIIIKVLPKLAKGWVFPFLIYVKDGSPDSDRLRNSTSNLLLLLQDFKETSKCLDRFAFVSISWGKLESLTFAVFLTIPKSSSHWREGGRERIC